VIITALDFEATGLDKNKDRIIETALVLYSTGQNRILESTSFLVQSDGVAVTDEITEITGITQVAVDKFGYDVTTNLEEIDNYISQSDAVLAHNGLRYDKQMLDNSVRRLQFKMTEKVWIDTMTDIPGVKGEKLITMCAQSDILMPSAHGAMIDASSTLEMAKRHAKDPAKSFEKMFERAQSPLVLIQSHQDRRSNADAKKFKFRWNPDNKIWWKPVKEMDLKDLTAQFPFDWSRVDKSITYEMLDTDN
jgi:DNA polymerase III alpha subunit (gram-positive type)